MRVMQSRLREWWPEVIAAAFCVLIAVSQNMENAAAVVIAGVIFWAMGYRHRTLPLHRKMSRLADAAGDIVTEMRAERQDRGAEPRGPRLRLIRKGDTA